MNEIEQLTEIQRKVEAIIHGTTEEMRDKQPGVVEFRANVLRKITELRMQLVSRLRPQPWEAEA
jgi:hypothetical protein